MGARVLDPDPGFEPEIDFLTAEGRELRLRLDFARCKNLKALTKIDVLAGRWSWEDVPMELWPKALQIITVGDLSEDEAEQILHPRNAALMVRAWTDLWRVFAAPTGEQLERLLGSLESYTGFDAAPEDVQTALVRVVEWLIEARKGAGEEAAAPLPLAEVETG